MSDTDNNTNNQPIVFIEASDNLPSQESSGDTSNWDNRPIDAPDGRVHRNEYMPSQATSPQSVIQTLRPTGQQSGYIIK
ncbi:MAG: hypothetical protein WCI79_02590 [Candidatus Saccharibacteria bacterium]